MPTHKTFVIMFNDDVAMSKWLDFMNKNGFAFREEFPPVEAAPDDNPQVVDSGE